MKKQRMLVVMPYQLREDTATGIDLGNLLACIPPENILQICNKTSELARRDICRNYIATGNVLAACPWPNMASNIAKLLKQPTVKDVLQQIATFQPTIIFARPVPEFPLSLSLPGLISKELNIPIALSIVDDWPFFFPCKSFLHRALWKGILQKKFEQLIKEASLYYTISPEMASAYKQRYGFESTVLPPAIQDFPKQTKTTKKDFDTFTFLYCGGAHPYKELQSLRDFAQVIQELNLTGHQVSFNIYCNKYWSKNIITKVEKLPYVQYKGCFELKDKSSIFATADAFLLPINFDALSQKYLKYSFQTKMLEFAIYGSPILAYGPLENPSIMFLHQNTPLSCLTKRSPEELKKLILKFIFNKESYNQQANDFKKDIISQFSIQVVQNKLVKSLENLGT